MKFLLFNVLFFSSIFVNAQIGGKFSFEFLRLPANARSAGVGGINISLQQEDVNMFQANPALLSRLQASKLSFNYTPFYADINMINLAYVHNFKKIGVLGFGVQYINYATLTERDASGKEVGTFQAKDFGVTISKSHQIDNFVFGGSLKFLNSQIADANAVGIALDLGSVFIHPEKDFVIGLTIKNLGFGISKYTQTGKTLLPLDVQLGTSFKPQFMPFRFSITLQQLTKFDIVYLDNSQAKDLDLNGEPIVNKKSFFDKAFRHFVFGGELLIHKNFNARLGYNHLINRELRVNGIKKFSGFSFGFMLKLKALEFAFSRAVYHAVGARSFLTCSLALDKMRAKKKKFVKEN